jgi:hypothetical protein
MLSGLRVVHHPDPTDAGGLARKVAAWRPSITCGTPTFAGYILDRHKPEDAAALRLLVVGAARGSDDHPVAPTAPQRPPTHLRRRHRCSPHLAQPRLTRPPCKRNPAVIGDVAA